MVSVRYRVPFASKKKPPRNRVYFIVNLRRRAFSEFPPGPERTKLLRRAAGCKARLTADELKALDKWNRKRGRRNIRLRYQRRADVSLAFKEASTVWQKHHGEKPLKVNMRRRGLRRGLGGSLIGRDYERDRLKLKAEQRKVPSRWKHINENGDFEYASDREAT